jgi:peptidoglycan-associated lipoprotein
MQSLTGTLKGEDKMRILLVLLAILAITAYGCTPRTIVDDQGAGATDGQVTIEPISDGVTVTDGDRLTSISDRYKTSSQGVPEFGDIHFDYDSYSIQDKFRQVLDDLSAWLVGNNAILLVEGHCDNRGTREYNLALGDRRALSVKDYLLASGVPDLKIETVSYGEERPVCREESESCWSRNRRGHFVIEVVK